MLRSNVVTNQLPRVPEFYHGKSIFLTGAAGFVGSVLLETLLSFCPGITSIYILLRTKKKVQPHIRKEQIFNKKIFEKLKKKTPELQEKVRVIPGDVSQPNLGMNEADLSLILEEVSIVFHCAAVVNLKKPLEILLKNNVMSLNSVIELCRKMKKFEVLVYTSTAYSNCNHMNFTLKEEVYRLPFHSQHFLDALKKGNKNRLQELIAHCKPDWPNWYEFSKCLAENVIIDTASDLPVAIIRPSIVICTWKHPIPGYLEENFGFSIIYLGLGKGFLKVFYADPNCKLNFVPPDIVANAHVLAAWAIGTKRCASLLVVNCTASENLQIKTSECIKLMSQVIHEFPMPKSFKQETNSIIVNNIYLYCILAAYYHYFPAIILDGILRISGKKPRLYSYYRFVENLMSTSTFFLFHSFEFERNNLELLDNLICLEDKKRLTLDFKHATFLEMALSLPEGSPFYDWKVDKKSPIERQRIKHRRHLVIQCIHGIFLMASFLFLCWVFLSIF